MATTAASTTQSYLRDARLQAGYASRDTAAIKLNYSPETIGRHERGDVPVSPDDIIRYAEGYQRPESCSATARAAPSERRPASGQ